MRVRKGMPEKEMRNCRKGKCRSVKKRGAEWGEDTEDGGTTGGGLGVEGGVWEGRSEWGRRGDGGGRADADGGQGGAGRDVGRREAG